MAQGAEHTHAADAEQNFLGETIVGIAAVERTSEFAIARIIHGQIGIEEVYGNFVASNAFGGVAPGTKFDTAIFQGDRDARSFLFEEFFDVPNHRFFGLGAFFRKALGEETFTVEERNGNHGQADVGGSADGVTGKNAQAATIAGHVVLESNLHGKVSNKSFGRVGNHRHRS